MKRIFKIFFTLIQSKFEHLLKLVWGRGLAAPFESVSSKYFWLWTFLLSNVPPVLGRNSAHLRSN